MVLIAVFHDYHICAEVADRVNLVDFCKFQIWYITEMYYCCIYEIYKILKSLWLVHHIQIFTKSMRSRDFYTSLQDLQKAMSCLRENTHLRMYIGLRLQDLLDLRLEHFT